jgi:hypothetical protein
MDLRKLTLENLMSHMKDIEQKLDDSSQAETLLNAARSDLPIVDDLLDAMAMLIERGKSPPGSIGMERAKRDLLVILAIREIEQEEQGGSSRRGKARAS